jgi:ribosome-associated translation inhibitor RaiA
MTKPVQITFRNIQVSPALEEEVRSRLEWLESFQPALTGCKVVLEVPHRHRRNGRQLRVNIAVTMPGGHVVVNHEPSMHGRLIDEQANGVHKDAEVDGHRDAAAAVHDAFDLARRRLEEFIDRQRRV